MFRDLLWRIFYKRVEVKPEEAVRSTLEYSAEIESVVSKADKFCDYLMKILRIGRRKRTIKIPK